MTNILDVIIANKRQEVEAKRISGVYRILLEFEQKMLTNKPEKRLSFSKTLADDRYGIIAEFKRRSPSKGEIHPMAIASEIVPEYYKNGAACCSVLTDTAFFGGSLDDLAQARIATPDMPLLRKEFIIDRMQILEAAFYGANAVLLIASALSTEQIKEFIDYTHALNMETLLELHGIEELDKAVSTADMIGINNRNLTTFSTDTTMSEEMIRHLPTDIVKVAESGLTSIEEINRLREKGYRGFLIGESFMKYKKPGIALKNFINAKH